MNLILAFTDAGTITSGLIRAATRSNYSHVGIVSGSKVLDSDMASKGVREYPVGMLFKKYPRVLLVEYYIHSYEVVAHARSQLGKPYDLSAVIGIPFGRDWQEDDKWFCSELVAWALHKAGSKVIARDSWRVTPQDLLRGLAPYQKSGQPRRRECFATCLAA